MAEYTIAKTLSLQPSHAHSRKINILDFFRCVNGEQPNNLFTSSPNDDFVGIVENETIQLGTQIGGTPFIGDFDIINDDDDDPLDNDDFIIDILDEEVDVTILEDAECTETVYVIENGHGGRSIGLKPLSDCSDYVKFSQKVDDRNRLQTNRSGIYGKVSISPIYLNGSAEFVRPREERVEDSSGRLVSLKVYNEFLVRLMPMTEKIAMILINHLSTGFVRINAMPIESVELPSKNNDNDGRWIISFTASAKVSETYTDDIKQC
jgi:hypothetical protein